MTAQSPEESAAFAAGAAAQLEASLLMYQSSHEMAETRQAALVKRLSDNIQKAMDIDHVATLAVLASALDQLGAGMPGLEERKEERAMEVRFWAARASPEEIGEYLAAILESIEGKALHLNARKRAMVALWNTLDEKDRAAFLAYAEPGSAARAG